MTHISLWWLILFFLFNFFFHCLFLTHFCLRANYPLIYNVDFLISLFFCFIHPRERFFNLFWETIQWPNLTYFTLQSYYRDDALCVWGGVILHIFFLLRFSVLVLGRIISFCRSGLAGLVVGSIRFLTQVFIYLCRIYYTCRLLYRKAGFSSSRKLQLQYRAAS